MNVYGCPALCMCVWPVMIFTPTFEQPMLVYGILPINYVDFPT